MTTAYPLDHLVLSVAKLDEAQRRFRALGFSVAPVGVHPFGTKNCCIYLPDGTFLEPLAVADPEAAESAVKGGNAFVGGDRIFRQHVGEEGFAAIVLGTSDGNSDAARFTEAGFSGGDILEFSRDVVDKTGKTGTASFRLAFARDHQSAAPFFFTCQRVKTPKVDRSALQHHRNQVQGLRSVILTAPDPRDHLTFLEAFFGALTTTESDGSLRLKLPNAEILVEKPSSFAQRCGQEKREYDSAEGLRPAAVVFSIPDLHALETLFKADAIAYLAHNNALIAPPATGQGAHFIFEASA